MKRILVPIDGSALSARALPYAIAIARRNGSTIRLLRAAQAHPRFERDVVLAEGAALAEAEMEIAEAAGIARAAGVLVEPLVVYGDPAPAILDASHGPGTDLIVMSTHGRGGLGRLLHGSVADQVLRHAQVPVLAIPPAAAAPGDRPRLLVPLDGSATAESILAPAAALADALGAEMTLLQVIEWPIYHASFAGGAAPVVIPGEPDALLEGASRYLVRTSATLSTGGRAVRARVEIGPPTSTIVAVAHEIGAAAIAMATHGRGGLARLVLGSVATAVLERAEMPVLLARPADVGAHMAQADALPRGEGTSTGAGPSPVGAPVGTHA